MICRGARRISLDARPSVVVCAAQVVSALRAHQLAAVTGETGAAGGADLAVMLQWRFRFQAAGRTTL